MKHIPRVTSALAAALGLAALAGACGEEGSKGGPSPGAVRAEIRGPASIVPGQSASFAVIETLTNGTTRALPGATWTTSDTTLVQVTESGVATAQPRNGEIVLYVSTPMGARANKEVLVLPDGTYRLVGRVTDGQASSTGIPGVRLEATGGGAATTDNNGFFRLYGVPANAEIRLTRDGYVADVQSLQLSGNAIRNFSLTLDGSSRNYAGHYTLTVEAAQGCPTQRPLTNDLKRRSYLAIVKQSGSQLEVELTEPRFATSFNYPGNRLKGSVTLQGASFVIDSDYYYYYSDVMERLPDGAMLVLTGSANTVGSPAAGLFGSMNGWFSHLSGSNQYLGGCAAATFMLSPR